MFPARCLGEPLEALSKQLQIPPIWRPTKRNRRSSRCPLRRMSARLSESQVLELADGGSPRERVRRYSPEISSSRVHPAHFGPQLSLPARASPRSLFHRTAGTSPP